MPALHSVNAPPPNTRTRGYIDVHVHANACTEEGFTLDRLAEWMRVYDVERCIVLPLDRTLPRNDYEQAAMLRSFERYAGRIHRFCVTIPQDFVNHDQTVAWLGKENDAGAIGFGEHYGRHLSIDDPRSIGLYCACGEVGFPVLFHMDGNNNLDEPGLPRLESVLQRVPACTFIAHAPGWWKHLACGTCERLLQTYPNLYGDLSAGSGARAIGRDEQAGRAFLIRNADRLLFGTDTLQWSIGKEPAPQFSLLRRLQLPREVEQRIYHANAERLFAFDDRAEPDRVQTR